MDSNSLDLIKLMESLINPTERIEFSLASLKFYLDTNFKEVRKMEELLPHRMTALYFIVSSYKAADLKLPLDEKDIIEFILSN